MKQPSHAANPSLFKSSYDLLKAAHPMDTWITGHAAVNMARAYYGGWFKLLFYEALFQLYVSVGYQARRIERLWRVYVMREHWHAVELSVYGACNCDIMHLSGKHREGMCEPKPEEEEDEDWFDELLYNYVERKQR